MILKLECLLFTTVVITAGAELLIRQSSPPTNRGLGIYDGQDTTIEKHPYLVGLLYLSKFVCAGNIVSDSWVLTTVDCTSHASYDQFSIVAGSSDGTTGQSYTATNIVLHPKHGTSKMDYDYALIQIDGTFKWSDKIQPITLPSNQVKAGTVLTAAGWGDTKGSGGDQANGQLQQGNLTLQTSKFCASAYADYGFPWTERLLCAYNKGKTALCFGDFGDGLIYNRVIYGTFITTAKEGSCTSTAAPAILANIAAVTTWIKQVTGAKYEDEP